VPTDAEQERRTAVLFVAGQFVLIAALVLLPSGNLWPVPGWLAFAGTVVMLLGLVAMVLGAMRLGRGLTALPLPNEHAELRTDGAYRFVRHPIYAGLLAAAAARTATAASLWVLVAFGVLLGLLTAKAAWEEQRLAAAFAGYAAYAARTPRFVPRPWRTRP
jgi:protein-S-isoprenylcysteine O-methyltransferase Ste14